MILAIPAQHPGLTCSRKRTLFTSTVLAAVITVTAKYLSFVPLCMVDMQPIKYVYIQNFMFVGVSVIEILEFNQKKKKKKMKKNMAKL